ncbi:hypothetical protein [Pseudomonas sp. CFBP13509]|uniref:hypothetical protein n=1 Tax=Pseudomonas sp. CFBP13509 TaxID=2184008 RepID=UPI0010BFB63F|nr:hypothetical protein [Pseudomonas sp. CFBP13509]
MEFTTAYTPVADFFSSMNSKELNSFYELFMLNKPYCLDELIQAVWHTPGYESWNADFSPESLDGVAEWLASRIYKEQLSSTVNETGNDSIAGTADLNTPVLSEEAMSLAVLVGMYYGEVAVRNNPELSWSQLKGNKKQADYGQPVISASGSLPTNPVRVAHAFACAIADGSKTLGRLRETYNYWMQLIKAK